MRPFDGYPNVSYEPHLDLAHTYLDLRPKPDPYAITHGNGEPHCHLDASGNVYEHAHGHAESHLDATDYDASPPAREPDHHKTRRLQWDG
jgi:hypothetical protein